MKQVAIVAAHFVPSNLAAVHRARLWSLHLREFGWEPIIVTTHWKYYEEEPEFEICELLPENLEIIRTAALPTKPVRLIGDIGLRGFFGHLAALRRLCRSRRIDFVHITIPSFYSACLGQLIHRLCGVPYGIDYIDPWVHEAPGSGVPFTKAWGTQRLARFLEPWAVKKASLITGINPAYYEGMLHRNPEVRTRAVCAAMPYGGAEFDHEYIRAHSRPPTLFQAHAGKFNLIYAGAMLPHGYPILERLLKAIALLRDHKPKVSEQFHVHFVGTGKSPSDPRGFNVLPYIQATGVEDCASEHPDRLPYLDVLAHLEASSGVLIIGSIKPHYSPSKVFQAMMSRRPVFAVLHEESTAADILDSARAGTIIRFDPDSLPSAEQLKDRLMSFIYANDYNDDSVHWTVVNKHSARNSADILADAMTEAVALSQDPSRVANKLGAAF